jgi:hypothetical protein
MEQQDEEVNKCRKERKNNNNKTERSREYTEGGDGRGVELIVVSAQVSATDLTHPAAAASVSQTRNCLVGRTD